MQRRQITMEDGRYLIFYTFEDEIVSGKADNAEKVGHEEATTTRLAEPDAKPQAEEERRV
ncbi:MAG: hypothetical protein ACR2G4_13345 [Pyrinomonadaceae bacterium]